MYKNVELIHTSTHKDTAVKVFETFDYAKELISAPITVAEFYESYEDYPIVFVKDQHELWTASVIIGYKEKENLFVNNDGLWEKGLYVPASIRRYPFIFITQNDNQLVLGMDSDAVTKDKEDSSRKLFDDECKPSELLNGAVNCMHQFQADAASTSNFIKHLDMWELLEEKTAQIMTPDQKSYQINGFYVVNEEKLQHLSKKKKQDLCDQNDLSTLFDTQNRNCLSTRFIK